MDEIRETKTYLWGSISNKVDKIEAEADRLGWDAIIDMLADAMATSNNLDPFELFRTLYQYAFRLYYRIKAFNSPQPFNQIAKTTMADKGKEEVFYRVSNYDYKAFGWAISRGYTEYLTNNWFLVPEKDLSPSEKRKFEKQAKNNGV